MRPATENDLNAASCCCGGGIEQKDPTVPLGRETQQILPTGKGTIATASVQGGEAFLGTSDPVIPGDGEDRRGQVILAPFQMSLGAITKAEFQVFVNETGYVTDAERSGTSFVFHSQIGRNSQDLGGLFGTPWWRSVRGACWSNVTGDRFDAVDRSDHPVVHVSWNDAVAFARWAGGRLPSEVEWEHAARAGMGDVRYPWGDNDPDEGGGELCNTWSGPFPRAADPARAAIGTVASRSGNANGFGIFNLCGNVWEWTADCFTNNVGEDRNRKVLKGGSFLCHDSYCFRYRIAARIGAGSHVTTSHQGFRIAFD